MKRKKLDKNKRLKEVCEDPVVRACAKLGVQVLWIDEDPEEKRKYELSIINSRNINNQRD